MGKTGIVRHQLYLEHRTGIMHPESPQRLQSIYTMLDHKDFGPDLVQIEPRFATLDEILWVHDPQYVDLILDSADRAQVRYDPDTVASPQTYKAAWLAAGGVMEAVKAVLTKARQERLCPCQAARASCPQGSGHGVLYLQQ